MAENLIEVRNLKKYFPITSGFFKRKIGEVKAVDNISFNVERGATHALIGESGSGKTTTGKVLIRIYKPTAGEIRFKGVGIASFKEHKLKKFRRDAQMVFQDPTSALNPRKKVKFILMDPLNVHKVGTPAEKLARVKELLDIVQLPLDYLYKYPHMLSGGEKQRVGVGRALALNPKFLVLDEPTSSLDVSVQAKIINFLSQLGEKLNLTYLYISHDLTLIRNIADWTSVMYLGKIVESASTSELYKEHVHPYTKSLLSVVPTISEEEERLKPLKRILKGEIPSPSSPPSGCVFHTRCPVKQEICTQREPPIIEYKKGHLVKCHLFAS